MKHKWIASTLGHGDAMCEYCLVTNREAAAIGIMNECEHAPSTKPVTFKHKTSGKTIAVTTQAAMDRFFDNRSPTDWVRIE